MNGTACTETVGGSVAARIAGRVVSLEFDAFAPELIKFAKHVILDWMGTALAGAREPLSAIVAEQAIGEGAAPVAGLLGRPERTSPSLAALVNGTASHALDFDDTNFAAGGHVAAAVVPGLWALAEAQGASGAQVITALIAGYEAFGGVGGALADPIQMRGFHTTGVIGGLGATGACGCMLDLSAQSMTHALAIAACQTSGLKTMFGTMCKPFQAGRAAQTGVIAASLAAKGFTSNAFALEANQGFAHAFAGVSDFDTALGANEGYFLTQTLFKFHAACHFTHPTIECALSIRKKAGPETSKICSVRLRVQKDAESICDVRAPETGLEAKFSLTQNLAFALCGVDTGRLETYRDFRNGEQVERIRNLVEIEFVPEFGLGCAELIVGCIDGAKHHARFGPFAPELDLDRQRRRIEVKFSTLAEPVLGGPAASALQRAVMCLEAVGNIREIAKLCSPP